MDKTPFLAGVQQELFFLQTAARFMAGSRATGETALHMLEAVIRKEALSDAHLVGLGVLDAPRRDDDGYPARPKRDVVVRAMAEDCLDQMQHLGFFDEDGLIRPLQLAQIENRAWLRRAVLDNYSVQGRDGRSRTVIGMLNDTFETLERQPRERENDPQTAQFRRGLCLAEFMGLHFWMQELETEPGPRRRRIPRRAFGHLVLRLRKEALSGLDVGEGGIEYAATVMADAATDWLLETYKDARDKLAAGRSTVLMLCDARVLVPHGFPGSVQWLRPVDKLSERPRRQQRLEREERRRELEERRRLRRERRKRGEGRQ